MIPFIDPFGTPSPQVWQARREWFEAIEEGARGNGSYLLSEQGCALMADVQVSFCAGAWADVIVLATAVVDATLREVAAPGFTGNTMALITNVAADPRLQELRRRRNALVHVDPASPAITVDEQWMNREALESQARNAVELMFGAYYLTPGT